jgi:4-amino-4-deoxy-L-arabinose transferase-like glycosyltransferase
VVAAERVQWLRLATWILLGIALALALRAAWLDAALGRDEGGVAFIAQSWHHAGPFTYGNYFLDRPPLLVWIYRVAVEAGGATGIRVLGALSAALAVALTTLLAAQVSGPRAVPWAALVGGLLASSLAIGAVFTPGELIAVVPSAASMLMLVWAINRGAGATWQWIAAGALAAAALLVKQSFGDALAAGVVALVAAAIVERAPLRVHLARAGAYLCGVGAVVLALLIWMRASGTPPHALWYSIFGFRIQATGKLTGAGLTQRLGRLGSPVLDSGLAAALTFAALGIALLRKRPVLCVTLAAWLVAGVLGVLGGGSYWNHYLIELVPVATVGTAALFSRHRLPALLGLCVIVVPAAIYTVGPIHQDRADHYERSAQTVGRYVRSRALPGQTDYVLYSRPDVLYYAGLRNPYPYDWSLIMRAAPHAVPRLRSLLASRERPTWIVVWQPPDAAGLDRSGLTARLLARHYRHDATVCGHPILVARGARGRPGPLHVRCGRA